MDDFLSRLADKSLGFTAVIQPRPVSLFEPTPTGVDSPVAPVIPAMEMETVQEMSAPLPPAHDELAAKTEPVRPPQTSLLSETPLPTPQETILPLQTAATELARPQAAETQRPLPTVKKSDPSSLNQSPSPKSIPTPIPTDSLPPSIISPRVVKKVDVPQPDPSPEEINRMEPSVSGEVTAVPTPIIQRITAMIPPPAQENKMMSPAQPLLIPVIKPIPAEPTITPPIPVEQSERHPSELLNLASIMPPAIQPVPPLVEPLAETVATQPVQRPYRRDEPDLPEPIQPEMTIIPPPAATAVIQPTITLYQEPKRETAVLPDPTPTIEVRIGRIEVRAAPQPAPPVRKQPITPPVMSLEDYLRQRENGGVS